MAVATPRDARVVAAEHLRERVYGTVSVLGTLGILLWEPAEGAGACLVAVLLTSGSIFLASLLADVTGHLGNHQELPERHELVHLVKVSSQVLVCAVVPSVLLLLAELGRWHLHTALAWAAAVQVLTLGVVGALATKGTGFRLAARSAIIAAEVALGLVIVGVKFLAH